MTSGFGPISFLSFDEFAEFQILDFFDIKILLSGQIDFPLVFGGLAWLLGAQTDLYPLLPNVVVVVGCVDGSCRRDRHLLGLESGGKSVY